jgi:hypothetical protein
VTEPNTTAPDASAKPQAAEPPPPDIEQPACFYLGREYDLAAGKVQPDKPIMYDARDLTTHGVVVGMTGSGKTGLCISLLEEAAIDGIPCVIIDPKGDLTNLLLQFPDLAADDFLPWMNPEDSRRKKLSKEEHAAQVADSWRKGLGDSCHRISLCRESSEWRVYTPGSEAGLPLSVLQSFKAPEGEVTREALNQRLDATASAVLGLTGTSADPVQSREHILIAQVLLNAWSQGKDLDLKELIRQVQLPPMQQVGAFDVETFYPEKDRLKLAVALNNILAAPGFSTWITGEPLDLGKMLYAGDKPRQLIFYVAHLDDTQRMFFVTLLLEEILNWTRKQPGTAGLRALVYFDEVFGYLPPHPANPPTKVPLMTLLKQARAFGVGVLLATQNPVDLDYKALSNAGTWFVGKLQTERDKARLVEGLLGVAAERGTLSDRNYLETVISSLKNRVFLLHNVHQPKPVIFQTRWALSYLRGPMTRDQVAALMKPLKDRLGLAAKTAAKPAAKPVAAPVAVPICGKCHAELPPGAAACPACGEPRAPAATRVQDQAFKDRLQQQSAAAPDRPTLRDRPEPPADVREFFLPVKRPADAAQVVYEPRVLACADVAFVDRRKGIEHRRGYRLLAEPPATGAALGWATAEAVDAVPDEAPVPGAGWRPLPESLDTAKKFKALEKSFAEYLYNTARLRLFENRTLGLVSAPQEDVQAFQKRCQEAAFQEADKAYEAEKQRYLPRFNALELSLPDCRPGRPGESRGVLGWAWTGVRLGAAAMRALAGGRGKLPRKQRELEAEWRGKVASLYERWRQAGDEHAELFLTPRRIDVQVTAFGLAWAPYVRAPSAAGGVQVVAGYK